jgi:hypothetical protein
MCVWGVGGWGGRGGEGAGYCFQLIRVHSKSANLLMEIPWNPTQQGSPLRGERVRVGLRVREESSEHNTHARVVHHTQIYTCTDTCTQTCIQRTYTHAYITLMCEHVHTYTHTDTHFNSITHLLTRAHASRFVLSCRKKSWYAFTCVFMCVCVCVCACVCSDMPLGRVLLFATYPFFLSGTEQELPRRGRR